MRQQYITQDTYYAHPQTGEIQTRAAWEQDRVSMAPEQWGGDTFGDAELIPVTDPEEIAPWAVEVIEIDGGWIAFESADDAQVWKNQQ